MSTLSSWLTKLPNFSNNLVKNKETFTSSSLPLETLSLSPISISSWTLEAKWTFQQTPSSCKRKWQAANSKTMREDSSTVKNKLKLITKIKMHESPKQLSSRYWPFRKWSTTKTNNSGKKKAWSTISKISSTKVPPETVMKYKNCMNKFGNLDPKLSSIISIKLCRGLPKIIFIPAQKPIRNLKNISNFSTAKKCKSKISKINTINCWLLKLPQTTKKLLLKML